MSWRQQSQDQGIGQECSAIDTLHSDLQEASVMYGICDTVPRANPGGMISRSMVPQVPWSRPFVGEEMGVATRSEAGPYLANSSLSCQILEL